MKMGAPLQSASALIDQKIKELETGAATPSPASAPSSTKPTPTSSKSGSGGTPVFSHAGIVCTGETYKSVGKLTFVKGAALADPSHLFNSSLDRKVRPAIDLREHDPINEAALKDLIRAAVALNLEAKPKSRREPRKTPAIPHVKSQTLRQHL